MGWGQDGLYHWEEGDPESWRTYDGQTKGSIYERATDEATAKANRGDNSTYGTQDNPAWHVPAELESAINIAEDKDLRAGQLVYARGPSGEISRVPTSLMTGELLDRSAYGSNELLDAEQNLYSYEYDRLANRDINQFAVDRPLEAYAEDGQTSELNRRPQEVSDLENIGLVGTSKIKAAQLADGVGQYEADGLSNYQIKSAHAGTDYYLNQAGDAFGAAQGGDVRALTEEQLAMAALGYAPSAAEAMYGRAGSDYAYGLDAAQNQYTQNVRRGMSDINAQQASLAAGARGDSAGLALVNAQNQTQIGQAKLMQQALDAQQQSQTQLGQGLAQGLYGSAQTRATEMADARGALSQYGLGARGADTAIAQGLNTSAGIQNQSDQQQLAARLSNVAAANTAAQFNAGNALTAAKTNEDYVQQARMQTVANQLQADTTNVANNLQLHFKNADILNQNMDQRAAAENAMVTANVDRRLQAQQFNRSNEIAVATDNANRALTNQQATDAAQLNVAASVGDLGESHRAASIQAEQDASANVQHDIDRAANYLTGNQTMSLQQNQFETNRRDKIVGGIVGGAASALGSVVTSDRRTKRLLSGKLDAPDFRAASAQHWEYLDPELDGCDDGEHFGPMAQELPEHTLEEGEDGILRVKMFDLVGALAAAVGDLQRQNDQSTEPDVDLDTLPSYWGAESDPADPLPLEEPEETEDTWPDWRKPTLPPEDEGTEVSITIGGKRRRERDPLDELAMMCLGSMGHGSSRGLEY